MTDWSSSRFSRRSTAHTCQPGALATKLLASGAKYAAPADVPGLSTRTLRALEDPILRMPTLSYFAGVPATFSPSILVKRGAEAPRAGAVDTDSNESAPART